MKVGYDFFMPRRGQTNRVGSRSADLVKDTQVGGVFVNHEAALDFLNSTVNFEQIRAHKLNQESFKLERMEALVCELDDPHLAVPVVHIAGSKGKGSTCAMLESCLRSCGYTTGLFTSPHLTDECERVCINGVMVDEGRFDEALSACKDAAIKISKKHGRATYFELLTALAFVIFAQEAVDIVILETGLGGRLDCTNVVNPVVVGLTSIQLEHTSVLGSTLGAIAWEKAGIMKPGVLALSVPQPEEVLEVFGRRSEEIGCALSVLGGDLFYSCRFQSTMGRGPHPKVCVGSGEDCFEHMSVPLLGEHQGANCGLALGIVLALRERGFDLPERGVIAGLESTARDGRLEQVNDRPRVYVDGAHTPESVGATLRAVAQHVKFDSLIIVFGCSGDKQVDGMLEECVTWADKIVFTRASSNGRAMDEGELAKKYSKISNKSCESYSTPTLAIRAAGKSMGGNDLLLVLGSFYIAGEVKGLFQAKASASV